MAENVPTAVYRFYDADDRLLYVGLTDEPKKRFRWHEKHSSWWVAQARRKIDWYDSRDEAATEETQAIRTESPIHNRAGTPQRKQRKSTRPPNLAALDGHRLAGAHEIASVFGVSRQRVQQMVSHPEWPAPCAVLAMGKLWTVEDVRAQALVLSPAHDDRS